MQVSAGSCALDGSCQRLSQRGSPSDAARKGSTPLTAVPISAHVMSLQDAVAGSPADCILQWQVCLGFMGRGGPPSGGKSCLQPSRITTSETDHNQGLSFFSGGTWPWQGSLTKQLVLVDRVLKRCRERQ